MPNPAPLGPAPAPSQPAAAPTPQAAPAMAAPQAKPTAPAPTPAPADPLADALAEHVAAESDDKATPGRRESARAAAASLLEEGGFAPGNVKVAAGSAWWLHRGAIRTAPLPQ